MNKFRYYLEESKLKKLNEKAFIEELKGIKKQKNNPYKDNY